MAPEFARGDARSAEDGARVRSLLARPRRPALRAPASGRPVVVQAAPPERSGLRKVIVPVLILAAVGYGGKTAYDSFVEGRFVISTDDAYVGADSSIIAAKAKGHLTAVPVVDNQIVHKGDLLAAIDQGDFQNASTRREHLSALKTQPSPGSPFRSTTSVPSSRRPKPRSIRRLRSQERGGRRRAGGP